jgi:hypothetical protein
VIYGRGKRRGQVADPEVRPEKGSKRRKVFTFLKWVLAKFLILIKWLIPFIVWLLWDFSGLRFICGKIKPPNKEKTDAPGYKPPVTLLIWLIGIYAAFFGVASQRYENRVDKIENRANAIFPQLSTSVYKKALGRIARVQNMGCPYKPRILEPSSVFRSLFSKDTEYTEMVELLRETIEDWKDSLDGVKLIGANLRGANLFEANLKRANLGEANLGEANLWGAILLGADLEGANLRGAYLGEANLGGANLRRADLRGAYLEGAKNLTIEQLSKVKTLYEAELAPELMVQIKKNYPHLLQKPPD